MQCSIWMPLWMDQHPENQCGVHTKTGNLVLILGRGWCQVNGHGYAFQGYSQSKHELHNYFSNCAGGHKDVEEPGEKSSLWGTCWVFIHPQPLSGVTLQYPIASLVSSAYATQLLPGATLLCLPTFLTNAAQVLRIPQQWPTLTGGHTYLYFTTCECSYCFKDLFLVFNKSTLRWLCPLFLFFAFNQQ